MVRRTSEAQFLGTQFDRHGECRVWKADVVFVTPWLGQIDLCARCSRRVAKGAMDPGISARILFGHTVSEGKQRL